MKKTGTKLLKLFTLLIIVVNCFLLTNNCYSQGASINTTGAAADGSAYLDISGNAKGILIPRLTTTERNNNISNPAQGLLIYNLDCNNFEYFSGTSWVAVNPTVAGVNISANHAGAVCAGTNVTFTATPFNGGTSPSYQWKVNNVNAGTNSNTYSSSTLANGDQVSCQLTSNASCVSGNPATSNVITMFITSPPTVANAGTDQNLCNVNTTTLSANTPSSGTGSWSVVSGTATITTPSSPTSGVTGLALPGTATLRWTISNSPCSSSTDDVVITTSVCFTCGTSNVSFTYKGSSVTYGTVHGNYNSGQYCWLDRNIGATAVATAIAHTAGYGDLFQWGRLDDGHQTRSPKSGTTTTLSSSTNPGHSNFIQGTSNWYSGPNPDNLWQGVSGINNPCPTGWRLPAETEINNERSTWASLPGGGNNYTGAIVSALRLPAAGNRYYSSGSINNEGTDGYYCTSTVSGTSARCLTFFSTNALMNTYDRAYGNSVRCIKDY